MKHFMKKTIAVLLALALFCGMVPAAFAADARYYKIALDTCGGVGVPMDITTGANGKLSSLPTPEMEGYTFDGWYTDLVAGEKVTADTVFEADSTIYAYWISDDVAAAQPDDAEGKGSLKDYIGTIVVTGIAVFSLTMLALGGGSSNADAGVAVQPL